MSDSLKYGKLAEDNVILLSKNEVQISAGHTSIYFIHLKWTTLYSGGVKIHMQI